MWRMSQYFSGLLILVAWAGSVAATLYGTAPIASTVWSADHTETITWVDDGRHPPMSKMGKMDIELYVGQNNHVVTLASHVDPGSESHKLKVSPKWGHNGSDYHVRFVFASETIYTADFTITDMDEPSSHKAKFVTRTSSSVPAGASLFTPIVTFVLPDTTVVSQLSPTYMTPRPTNTIPSSMYSSYSPVGVEGNTIIQVEAEPTGIVRSNDAAAAAGRMDIEKLKFRVVFILWPALIGLTMAL
ncbi:unnamed protein product [Somion occarium]|uniref:Yeast cell wall synthesis Kre9/Knh1-like N-terminal domain-containing protein n=1 Tax=Somion occarium TaxID=3059160 RepID=A0ABP1DUV9_9APHY